MNLEALKNELRKARYSNQTYWKRMRAMEEIERQIKLIESTSEDK